MNRYLPLPVVAALAISGAADAQQRQREDLLDALTRHIQICSEINDSQSRLAWTFEPMVSVRLTA